MDELKIKGYCIINDVLSPDEVSHAKNMFINWQQQIQDFEKIHNIIDPHGIYKHHEAGHQRHAWYIRTLPNVINTFKQIWDTDDLTVGFDGSCYIPKNCVKKDSCWTHTDQAPSVMGLTCYQGLVALTSNKERTLVVYEGSHLLHERYHKDRGIDHKKNWNLIDPEYLDTISDTKKVLDIPAGSLVLWDSRCFHQNQYGIPNSEERYVQYVCMLPKNGAKNTKAMEKKRRKYFDEKRTTSHWPYPIHVNSKQPRTYGNTELLIDYDNLPTVDLNDMRSEIEKLL